MSDLHAGLGAHESARVRRRRSSSSTRSGPTYLLLGDYLDSTHFGSGRADPDEIAARAGRLDAPLGRFAVLGNHDWRAAGGGMWSALRAAGLTVLENEAAQAGELWVAGLADMRTRIPDVASALRECPRTRR